MPDEEEFEESSKAINQLTAAPSDIPRKRIQWEFYKTRLCRSVVGGPACNFGKRCIYAHCQSELRPEAQPLGQQQQSNATNGNSATTPSTTVVAPVVVSPTTYIPVPVPVMVMPTTTPSGPTNLQLMGHHHHHTQHHQLLQMYNNPQLPAPQPQPHQIQQMMQLGPMTYLNNAPTNVMPHQAMIQPFPFPTTTTSMGHHQPFLAHPSHILNQPPIMNVVGRQQ